MEFIAREKEIKTIESTLQTDQFELVPVYGRRHIGKTELLKHCCSGFHGKFFYYMCRMVREPQLVSGLTEVISDHSDLSGLYFKDFESGLRYLFRLGEKEPVVLVLDEYPNARKMIQGPDSILQALADEFKFTSKLKLFLSGSYIDIMKELNKHESPLFGRITRTIDLKQMDYYDSVKFYSSFSDEDKVQLYSVFGGMPVYNSLIRKDLSEKKISYS